MINTKKVTKAIIPAAGFATRFLPQSKSIPKEMLPLVDTPTLDYIVRECVESGITDILIVINSHKKAIEDYFDRSKELEALLLKGNKLNEIEKLKEISNLANFYFIRQPEMNGTAGVVKLCESFVKDEPFALLFGDDLMYSPNNPVTKQLIKAYEKTGSTIVGCQEIKKEDLSKYGIVLPGKKDGALTELINFVEKPKIEEAPSNLANLGRFILTPDIFDYINKTKSSKNGETYLTDSIALMANDKKVYAYTFEGKRYDIGDKFGYVQANIEYALRNDELSDKVKAYLKELVKTI